jgi:hypothetical protein
MILIISYKVKSMSTATNTRAATTSAAMSSLERALSIGAGAGLLVYAIRPRLLRDLALLAAGGYFLYRGVQAQGPLFGNLWSAAANPEARGAAEFEALMRASRKSHKSRPKRKHRPHDDVDEASALSFPASDPPAVARSTARRPSGNNKR